MELPAFSEDSVEDYFQKLMQFSVRDRTSGIYFYFDGENTRIFRDINQEIEVIGDREKVSNPRFIPRGHLETEIMNSDRFFPRLERFLENTYGLREIGQLSELSTIKDMGIGIDKTHEPKLIRLRTGLSKIDTGGEGGTCYRIRLSYLD